MEPMSIRTLTKKDLEFAYELNTTEQWNDREDLSRMYHYEPKGCFGSEIGKRPLGHIFSVSNGKLAWIGLLIVKTEFRRRGTATQLMKKAIDYLLQCGVKTIKLEAVPQISELYRTRGRRRIRLAQIHKNSLEITPTKKGYPNPNQESEDQ